MSVSGDPASCSQLGGSLRLLAARLRTSAGALPEAQDQPRGGAVLARARRRAALLSDAVAVAALELDRAGAALQAHASELAEAVSDARSLLARAEAAGLEQRDGVLVPRWGVAGVADEGASAAREEVGAQLQDQLDHVEALLRRRRLRLAAALRSAGEVVGTHAGLLRR